MYEMSNEIWDWKQPKVYPPPWFEGMKMDTLSVMLDSGNLQWYEPRPEQGAWDAVVGGKVHAPLSTVWKVVTDYEGQCRMMSKTFTSCKTQWRQGDTVKNDYRIKVSVLEFATEFDMIDVVKEYPPARQHINTIEGGLKGRELDIILVPADEGRTTLYFMRYHAHMKSLGLSMQAVLALVPMAEWPVTAASANYHMSSHRKEAEKLAGYKPPAKPAPLDYEALDVDTLAALSRVNAGLIRETPEGKTISGLAFAFINAPPGPVWDLVQDLEHYNDFFRDQDTRVEKRQGNKVWVAQETTSQSVLVFTFGYQMRSLYTLDPPRHLSYRAYEGAYEGSFGDLYILPINGGKQCVLFCETGLNFDKDTALTARIIRSGDFPFNTVMDLLAVRAVLNNLKPEAERRAKAGGH
jgi:carbon monoxide dehydrogenase subunit G